MIYVMNPDLDISLKIIDLVVKVLGGLAAVVLFLVGLRRYNKEQRWKRKEFVSKEIKEFNDDKMNRNARLMLDWDTRPIELYPEISDYDKRFVMIGRKELERALMPHGKLKNRFTKDEAIIRDTFDHYLEGLTRFEHFIETKIVSLEDFKPYLNYWINLIAEDLPERARCVLHHYLIKYKYDGVISLINRFGKEIKPSQTLFEKILTELNENDNPQNSLPSKTEKHKSKK